MGEKLDPSNCVRYTLGDDLDSACQKLITWLSDCYLEIFLIHQESHINHNWVSTQLTLIHRLWVPTVMMEIIQKDATQTLILISALPDPALEDVSPYESKINESNLPDDELPSIISGLSNVELSKVMMIVARRLKR